MCYKESRLSEWGFAYDCAGADNVIICLVFINVTWEEVVRSIYFYLCYSFCRTHTTVSCCILFFTVPVVRLQDVQHIGPQRDILTTTDRLPSSTERTIPYNLDDPLTLCLPPLLG